MPLGCGWRQSAQQGFHWAAASSARTCRARRGPLRLSSVHTSRAELVEAIVLAQRVLALGGENGHEALLPLGHIILAVAQYYQGPFEGARAEPTSSGVSFAGRPGPLTPLARQLALG
jgi:hypothetical protein